MKLLPLHAGGGSLYEGIAYVIEKLLPFFFSFGCCATIRIYYLTDF